MSGTPSFEDLAPITPDGRNPAAIERAFQQLNSRYNRLRNLVIGEPVFNDDGTIVKTAEGSIVRTPATLG